MREEIGVQMEARSHGASVGGVGSHREEGWGLKAQQGRRPHVKGNATKPDEEGHVGRGDVNHGGKG